ncbi:MAG TPA: fatty acid--CoA ligase family protein [Candidatus Polarisedimenticolia bacterium]|nr:fatty acid--CoA ligase family protein [Candidatus Polarisedimenticolia bacterium]
MRSIDSSPRALFARARGCLRNSPLPRLLVWLPSRCAFSGPELLGRIERLSRALSGAGLSGGRVLAVLSDPLSATLVLPALWSLDCIPFLADGRATRPEVDEMIRRFRPDHLLEDAGGVPSLRPPPLRLRPLPARQPRLSLPRETVLVRTTSGSTGPPRGVALSASQMLADASNILASLRTPPEWWGLAAVPLTHAFGFSTLLSPLLFHSRPVVMLSQPTPDQFRAALRGRRSFFFPGVPYLFDMLGRARIPRRDLRRLKLCVSAGAPLPPETALRFRALSGSPVRNFYGTSECGAIACERSRRAAAPPGCAGRPMKGIRLSLEKRKGAEGRRPEFPRSGRVLVEGESVALGYVGAGARLQLFRGRFATGDLGKVDSRNRLHLLGRLDRQINVSGRKVWPAEVESLFRERREIREAVAVGIPDAARGEVVAVAVESETEVSVASLLGLCRARLSLHKMPKKIQVFRRLPRNARGKADTARIRELLTRAPSLPEVRCTSPDGLAKIRAVAPLPRR